MKVIDNEPCKRLADLILSKPFLFLRFTFHWPHLRYAPCGGYIAIDEAYKLLVVVGDL